MPAAGREGRREKEGREEPLPWGPGGQWTADPRVGTVGEGRQGADKDGELVKLALSKLNQCCHKEAISTEEVQKLQSACFPRSKRKNRIVPN